MVATATLRKCAFRGEPFTTRARTCRWRAPRTTCSSVPASDRLVRRRDFLGAAVLLGCQLGTARAEGAEGPPLGDCPECIGEVNGGLNACALNSTSCVSTQNDDEAHFVPPWQYDGEADKAIQSLIDTATGRTRGAVADASGASITLKDSARYTLEKFEASLTGGQPPKKPQRRSGTGEAVCFDGRLVDRHSTSDGSEYLHIVFGEDNSPAGSPACRDVGVIDAEFIFLTADNVVDIRTASRVPPGLQGGAFSLSLSTGVSYDTNVAKRQLEELRKALRWEAAPVVTDFDPRFNQRRPLFFERLYQPFLQNKQEFEPIVDK